MINQFPYFYKDEILYGTLSRYHLLSGNLNYKDTLKEIFGSESLIPTIEFPSKLEYFENNCLKYLGLSADYIIQNHSMLPLYVPFIPKQRLTIIKEEMKHCDGKGIKAKVGTLAGGICKKDELMYCPICAKDDIKTYGQSYFHRIHQCPGVNVCPQHHCLLNKYAVNRYEVSRLKYINFEQNLINLDEIKYIDNQNLNLLVDVAKGLNYLLDNNLEEYDQNWVHKKYRLLLEQKGLLIAGNRIRQRELFDEFKAFYPRELLTLLESDVDANNEYNWLKVALRNQKRVTHPIRNILIILFLSGGLEAFFQSSLQRSDKKYYPCLNPVCSNYRKHVVRKYEITYDSKSKKQIITLYCKCGFVYARKVSDDIYSVGRIKNFGHVWEEKLKDLIISSSLSLRRLALTMRCDPKTIVKYAEKLGLSDKINSKMKLHNESYDKITSNKIDSDKYRKNIIALIKDTPGISRTEVRNRLKKQYMWLYRNDREWLDKNMPERKNNNYHNQRVSWNKRDDELLKLLQNEFNLLKQLNDSRRITTTLIGRRINMLALLEKNLDKLPKSKNFIESMVETVEDFQKRRVGRVIADLKSEGKEIAKWKIYRKAGLRQGSSAKIEEYINYKLRL